MASKSSRNTWIAVAIAAVVIVIGTGLAVVGGSAYFLSRHIHAQFVSTETAEQQFAQARAPFADQVPLIELNENERPVIHHPPDGAPRAPIAALHAVVYNTDSRKLVTINVPMWVLRMLPTRERFSFVSDDVDFDSRRDHLTLEDVDRHGPGLILDGHGRNGDRVLIWAE